MVQRTVGATPLAMDLDELRLLTVGEWPVELVESDGLWDTTAVQTLLFLPPFLGPSGTLLVHLLAYTHPTRWTTDQISRQLGGLSPRRTLETLGRAADFHVIRIGSLGIEVPTRLGPLQPELVRRYLPQRMRHLYDRLAEGS